MAREVIADIDFDNTGSVRLRGLEGDLGGLQSQTEKTANVFTHRMFNMRTAAMAFLGSFTLAGVIFGLKNLAEEVIKSSSNFDKLAGAGDRLQASFFSLARETFNVSKGVETAVTWTDRLNAVIIAAQQAQEAAGAGKTGIVLRWLFGQTSVGNVLQVLNQTQELVGKIIDKMLPSQLAAAQNPLFDPKRVDQWEAAVKSALAALPGAGGSTSNLTFGDLSGVSASGNNVFLRMVEPIHKSTLALEEWEKAVAQVVLESNQLSEVSPNITALVAEQNKGVDVTKEWEAAVALLNDQMDALANPGRFALLGTLKEMFEKLSKTLTVASLKFDVILASVNEFASQISTAITEGGVTIRSFVADMLKMVGQMLLAWGALAVITTYFTGYPGYHVAAAAIAAGLAALVASRAVGGGREQVGGQGGGAAAAASGGAGSSSLTVNFGGPTFGFNEQAFARYILDLQRRGARGNG